MEANFTQSGTGNLANVTQSNNLGALANVTQSGNFGNATINQ